MSNAHFISVLVVASAAVACNAGCVAQAEVSGYAEAEAPVVFVEPPTLVAIDADVWVVRDHHHAVYYVDGFYWVHRDHVWHRARSYDSGWAVIEVGIVPRVIVHRDHRAYVRFRGSATARTRPAPRAHAGYERHHGPPDHAASQHGGPPGHGDTPGLGDERRARYDDDDDGRGRGDEHRAHRREDSGSDRHRDSPGRSERRGDDHDRKHEKGGKSKRK